MSINPSSTVRTGLYVLSVFINAVMGVLVTSEVVIPIIALALVAGFNAVVAIMAGANVTQDN
jgi:hypothetical protein